MKLIKCFFLAVCFLGIGTSYAQNRKLLKNHDYSTLIRNAIEKLTLDAKDIKAAATLTRTYSEATTYYQNEIDQILTGNDPFKWKKTWDIMGLQNEISGEILDNSSAIRLICEPKRYTSELIPVKQKAVAELYEAGDYLLNLHDHKKAREAFDLLEDAAKLESGYKEVGRKIQEAKELATIKIVVEEVAAYARNKNLFSKRFYQAMLYNLQTEFVDDNFVILCTPEEAKRRRIEKPDLVVSVAFIDFQMGQPSDFDGTRQININGVIELKVFSPLENKDMLNSRFPGQYVWQNYSNRRNDLQGLFDAYSLSMCDQVVDRLSLFFRQYK
jgi:hypothetical protein